MDNTQIIVEKPMLRSEPIKGKFYLILSRDTKGRREGLTVGRFIERQYCGCQLHGDRIGYSYVFARNDVTSCASPEWLGVSSIFVKYDDGEKDFSKVLTQLQQRVIPLPDGFDAFALFNINESKAV